MNDYILKKALSVGVLSVLTVLSSGFAEHQPADPANKYLSDSAYPEQSVSKIAFGSCNKPKMDQGFWNVIRAQGPDVMLLLGDNHYAESTDPVRIKKAYDNLASIPQYSRLRQAVPTFATWDNHDYGAKYPGRLHPHAAESEQLFLEHFSIAETDARRQRDGIYGT